MINVGGKSKKNIIEQIATKANQTDVTNIETYLYNYGLEDGVIKVPSDFTASLPCKITKKGDIYSHDFTFDKTGYTDVFISVSGGSFSGLTEAQPIKLDRFVTNYNASVYSAYTKIRLVFLDAVYNGVTATLDNFDLDLILEPKTGRTWIGKIIDESNRSYFSANWGTYNAINVINLVFDANVIDLVNLQALDVYGIPAPYKQATSIANCEATKGSWYKDSVNLKLYCNPFDSEDIHKAYINQNAAVLNVNVKSGRKAIFNNLNFVSSSYAFTGQSITSSYYFTSCKFYRGLQDAFHTEGDYKCYSFDCVAAYGSKDCFNYYKGVDTNTLGFEVNCVAYGAGKYKLNGGNTSTNSNNASTSHNGMKVMRVGCRYFSCEGPIVADADNCYSINIGCYTGTILSTATGILAGFYMYNSGQTTNKQYVVNCRNNNFVGYDVRGEDATTYVMNVRGRNKVLNVQAADLSSLFLV